MGVMIGTIRLGMHKGGSYRMTHSSYVLDVRKWTLDIDVHTVVVDVQTQKSDYQGVVVNVQLVKSDYQALVVDVCDARIDVHQYFIVSVRIRLIISSFPRANQIDTWDPQSSQGPPPS